MESCADCAIAKERDKLFEIVFSLYVSNLRAREEELPLIEKAIDEHLEIEDGGCRLP